MADFVLGVAAVIVGEAILLIALAIGKADWSKRTWYKIRFGSCMCGWPMVSSSGTALICLYSAEHAYSYSSDKGPEHESYNIKHCHRAPWGTFVRVNKNDQHVKEVRERMQCNHYQAEEGASEGS